MIKELAEFGKRIRTGHDALKAEPIDIDLVIKEDGSFDSFSVIERIQRPAEAITAKKGKARLLLDKAEEVLCFVSPRELKNAKENEEKALEQVKRKHQLYLCKLNEYKNLEILKPVFLFYYENRSNGMEPALQKFPEQVKDKVNEGNIAFRVNDIRLHEHDDVYNAIIERYERDQEALIKGDKKVCSICGKSEFPVIDKPHGYIKSVPDGQEGKNVLVSYNEKAFESYGLVGNFNSSICTNCAKNYVEGLNYLLTNGYIKDVSKHTNRKNLGPDTAVVFWTREPENLDEMDWFDTPDAGRVANLIESVANAKNKTAANFKPNQFYSLTLSGAAARIAIRDWIEISLDQYRQNIARWFDDVKIKYYDADAKELQLFYPALNQLSWACNRKEAKDDPTASRVAKYLWGCAIKNQAPPLWILPIVLKRIAHNETNAEGKSVNTFTNARASLLKLILNRNNYGGTTMKEELDFENTAPAYLCGRLFSLIEGIQRAALGKDVNAGVRERFFAAASSSPSPAFGRLMRNMQNHLTKVRQEKPGLAVILDTEVTDLCAKINGFPLILTLEQQGQFALGYYHQKHYNFNRAKQNKEFESITEPNNMEEQ